MKIFRFGENSLVEYFHGSYATGTVLTPKKSNFMVTFRQDEMDSHFKLELFRPNNFLSNGIAHYNESVWEFLAPAARIIREVEEF